MAHNEEPAVITSLVAHEQLRIADKNQQYVILVIGWY